jgi:hypothetical protein
MAINIAKTTLAAAQNIISSSSSNGCGDVLPTHMQADINGNIQNDIIHIFATFELYWLCFGTDPDATKVCLYVR